MKREEILKKIVAQSYQSRTKALNEEEKKRKLNQPLPSVDVAVDVSGISGDSGSGVISTYLYDWLFVQVNDSTFRIQIKKSATHPATGSIFTEGFSLQLKTDGLKETGGTPLSPTSVVGLGGAAAFNFNNAYNTNFAPPGLDSAIKIMVMDLTLIIFEVTDIYEEIAEVEVEKVGGGAPDTGELDANLIRPYDAKLTRGSDLGYNFGWATGTTPGLGGNLSTNDYSGDDVVNVLDVVFAYQQSGATFGCDKGLSNVDPILDPSRFVTNGSDVDVIQGSITGILDPTNVLGVTPPDLASYPNSPWGGGVGGTVAYAGPSIYSNFDYDLYG